MLKLKSFFSLILEIIKLPKINISMGNEEISNEIYAYFTRPHTRFFFIKNKEIGVELIKLDDFDTEQAYLQSIGGKNSAAYFSRKAQKKGYNFLEICPEEYSEQIYLINTSASERQGRKMSGAYNEKKTYHTKVDEYWYGIFAPDTTLCAYMWIKCCGDIAIINRILGHNNHLNFGIMYLLSVSVIQRLINKRSSKYFMYDTFFGASEGLRLFKKRIGFKPYRVKWNQK